MKDAVQKKNYEPKGLVDVYRARVACDHLAEAEAAELARRLFNDTFMDTAQRGERSTHDGEQVLIFPDRLKHCFFQKPDRKLVHRERLNRIAWILPFIEGRVSGSECHLVEEMDGVKRIYCSYSHRYVVFLRARDVDEGWALRTAYGATVDQIRDYVRGGKRIARF